MKTPDMTKPVMDKVVAYEKARTYRWILRFIFLLAGLTVFELYAFMAVAYDIAQKQSLELLTLFAQDPEIIAEFWQDTLTVFWDELPQQTIQLAAVAAVCIVLLLVFTGVKRRIIRSKLSKLAKYEKTRNNRGTDKK